MKVLPIIFIIAITMALTITLIPKKTQEKEHKSPFKLIDTPSKRTPSKKISRFLVQQKNSRSSDNCHKDHEICILKELHEGHNNNSTCCSNKCVDLYTDHDHCGSCKRKCEFTETCCRGKCVDLSYDKGHCGGCNNRCSKHLLCIYGMCDYP